MNFLKDHPTIGGALLSLLGAVLALFIHNPPMVAALVGIAAVFAGLHNVVTPVTTMVENVTQAATDAATKTVEQLDKTTVGTITQVTDVAKDIILTTVDDVVSGLLKK